MKKLKIGWAERDITTYGPAYIPGHFNMRISEGVIDPLSTTALVVDNGDDMAIFLSIDSVAIRSFLLDEIRGKVKRRNPEIPVMKILAGATHAHTTPSHYYDGGEIDDSIKEMGYTDEQIQKLLDEYIPTSMIGVPRDGMEIESSDKYRDFLSDQASDAICEAYENRKEGGIGYGYGYAVVGHSRRTVYFDDVSKRPGVVLNPLNTLHGHAVMYGNTNDDNFSHYEGGADHFINIMYTFTSEGDLTGAVINIPCPSQNSESEANRRLTADYWHDIRQKIREKHGNIFILAQCGAGGDVSPRIMHYRDAQLRRFWLKYGGESIEDVRGRVEALARRDIAERVAVAFDEVLGWARKDIKTEAVVKHTVKTVHLSRRMITDEEYEFAKSEYEKLEAEPYRFDQGSPKANLDYNSVLKSKRNRFLRVMKRYEIQKTQPKVPMEMHAIRIGDIAFASNRFEMYQDYQHRIQARSPFMQTFIVQLCGQPGMESGSYLCTERAREGRGYSASMFCNVVSCEGGQELVEETLAALRELAD
ncbi:MAG: hypothetical protein GX854_09205 [Clostridiales bacterium]|nr:hypothetical protein [Clostridiales bacterium]